MQKVSRIICGSPLKATVPLLSIMVPLLNEPRLLLLFLVSWYPGHVVLR